MARVKAVVTKVSGTYGEDVSTDETETSESEEDGSKVALHHVRTMRCVECACSYRTRPRTDRPRTFSTWCLRSSQSHGVQVFLNYFF